MSKTLLKEKFDDGVTSTLTPDVKEDMLLDVINEPVLPKLCKLLFRLFFVVLICAIVSDIAQYSKIRLNRSTAGLFHNMSISGSFTSLFFSLIELPCCLMQIYKIRKRFMDDKQARRESKGIKPSAVAEEAAGRAMRKQFKPYIIYIAIPAAASMFFAVLFVIIKLWF